MPELGVDRVRDREATHPDPRGGRTPRRPAATGQAAEPTAPGQDDGGVGPEPPAEGRLDVVA